MGEGRDLRKDYILRAAEDCLQAAADRLHRPASRRTRTTNDAARRNAGGLCAADRARQSARNRRLEPQPRAVAGRRSRRQAARGLPRYQSLQPHYNLYDRAGFERDYAPICRAGEIGVIPYYSLAGGFLTGKYRSAPRTRQKSARAARKVKAYFDARGLRILKALDEVAATA